ncbi:MAG: molybdopterin molybdotransferase MoeA [Spirochaetaceae bacterium]|nr:molybdopterin molybdotransferase MoeA [Spirochaetaceae bacterium]
MTALIGTHIKPLEKTEQVPFTESIDRICAEDVFSRNELPNRPASSMDSIGVRYSDFEKGNPDTGGWIEGREFVFCNTGVMIPEGYDTVIPVEGIDFDAEGKLIIRKTPAQRGAGVVKPGEQMRRGETLIPAGTKITPAHIGLFASGGVQEVPVRSKPTVSILPTGHELVPVTGKLPPGKAVDSNSHMLAAFLARWGAIPLLKPIVTDDFDAISKALEEAVTQADMAIIIAGSSKGSEDYTMDVLEKMGHIIVHELGHGPGKHTSLAMVRGKPVFGIPGPPFGAQLAAELYLRDAVRALLGRPFAMPHMIEVVLTGEYPARPFDFCERLHVTLTKDGYRAYSAFGGGRTRAEMIACSHAMCYRGSGVSYREGDRVQAELLCAPEDIPRDEGAGV